MGILNFDVPSAPVQRPAGRMPFGNIQNANEAPKAKLWLNIGYEANGRFVNLPLGMPIDTMKQAEVRGQNEDWVAFQNARNQLLQALTHFGMSLEPGAEAEIPTLTIKIRRVNEELEVAQEDNAYAIDLGNLFAAPSAQSQERQHETKEPALA